MQKMDIGLVGLGVMGENLALNLERNGFSVCGFDLDTGKRQSFGERIQGLREMLERLRQERDQLDADSGGAAGRIEDRIDLNQIERAEGRASMDRAHHRHRRIETEPTRDGRAHSRRQSHIEHIDVEATADHSGDRRAGEEVDLGPLDFAGQVAHGVFIRRNAARLNRSRNHLGFANDQFGYFD